MCSNTELLFSARRIQSFFPRRAFRHRFHSFHVLPRLVHFLSKKPIHIQRRYNDSIMNGVSVHKKYRKE